MNLYTGTGHSGSITKVAISPDTRTVISVGTDGAVFLWRTPENVLNARAENELPTVSKENENYE